MINKKLNHYLVPLSVILLSLISCGSSSSNSSEPSSSSSSINENSSSELNNDLYDKDTDVSYRQERNFTNVARATHQLDEAQLPLLATFAKQVVLTDGTNGLVNGDYRLDFILNQGKYSLKIFDINNLLDTSIGLENQLISQTNEPIRLFINGSSNILSKYDTLTIKPYGFLLGATLTTSKGSVIEVNDAYYIAKEHELGTFNVRKSVKVISKNNSDTGFASELLLTNASGGTMEYFVPNNIFKTLSGERSFRETQLGLPMMMIHAKNSGYTLSMARYQPIIHYENNEYASLDINPSNKAITIVYPSKEGNRKYHSLEVDNMHAFDVVIRVDKNEDYEQATPRVYNAHFNLQNQRIVATNIDEVYRVVNEDYKTFLHEENQIHPLTNKKYKSYGLPWRIHINDGAIGPYTYQAGFIGQQIPSAYNMMLYGLMNNDAISLNNGLNVIDFWVDDAEFMSIAGVPHIWYDTWANDFRAYPCFTRMAVDAMEGLLDAYRLALAHGISRPSWLEALTMYADFLAYNQNDDGSYYRTYNYDGGPFVSWDNGIEEPAGNITQSFSKANTPMPIRFLGKMYELTNEDLYKDAALSAGQYVYDYLYPLGYYQGGTCDNPNAIDKEAGVFAMYAYDTLYTLTKDIKWLVALKQATAFTMSTVLVSSFPVRNSSLKSAKPVMAAYTDGLSFINCSAGSGVDNYIAFIYYQLFRTYIHTGDPTYLKQAEFVQQNTKSIMDWDGLLNYPYRSLVAEASSVTTFTYNSADGGVWVTWSSVANIESIGKMYVNFGSADVAQYRNSDIDLLKDRLDQVGCGGKDHNIFENTIVN